MAELYPKNQTPIKTDVTDIAAKLKILEERYTNLAKRGRLAEENLLGFEKDIRTELRAFQKRVLESKKHISEIREKLDLIEADISKSVSKEELRVLEAYIDLWQPMNFITREEAEKLIKQKINDKY